MVGYYVSKILNQVKNNKTGESWTVEDVPPLWREKVRKAIEG